MRYSMGRRIAAATMCAVVALSSVNVEAIAQVTGADAGAALSEALAAAGTTRAGDEVAAVATAEKSDEAASDEAGATGEAGAGDEAATSEDVTLEAGAELGSGEEAAGEDATVDAGGATSSDAAESGEAVDEGVGAIAGAASTGTASSENTQIGDGAGDLRWDIDAATEEAITAESAVAAGNASPAILTTASSSYSVVDVEANVENPAFEGYAYVAGAVIKVTAAEGALPAGTRVEAKQVENEDYEAAIATALGTTLEAAVLFDITLVDETGAEVQPAEPVNVAVFDALTGEAVASDVAPQVFHVSEDGSELELITARQADAEVQSFDVAHFSTYAVVVGEAEGIIATNGKGTAASPYSLYTYENVTVKCTKDHEHEFWTEPYVYKGVKYYLFDIITQETIGGVQYAVLATTSYAFTGNNTHNQKLYCGTDKTDKSDPTVFVVQNNCTLSNYFIYDVELSGVRMGYASGNLTREIAPMFSGVTYAARGNSASGNTDVDIYHYWYVAPEDNNLIYYWDSYRVITYLSKWDSALAQVMPYNYSDLQNISGGQNTTTAALNYITRAYSSLNLLAGGYSAADYGYTAAGAFATTVYGYRPQLYIKVRSKGVTPTEAVTVTSTPSSSELKPGDTITFSATIDPQQIDLTTDTLDAEKTLLTKTSSVTVTTAAGSATSSEYTTDNAAGEVTSDGSDYTLSTLYTKKDVATTHNHTFEYVVTREDCIAALKERSGDSGTSTLTLTPSTTTVYNANLKVNGSELASSSISTLEQAAITVTIAQEHYVNYKLKYTNAESISKDDYPDAIKEVEDKVDLGGKDGKTPYWEGDTIEFAGYSVGTIVESKNGEGYWVFSGWYQGDTPVEGNLTMGTSDIEVTGEWTYVPKGLAYEMESWTYDGTFHAAVKSYAGTEETHVDSTPNSFAYYTVDDEGNETYVGSSHPTDVGKYKVKATWNLVTASDTSTPEATDENAENNESAQTPSEGEGGDAATLEEGESGDGDSNTAGDATSTTTLTSHFEIRAAEVGVASGSATQLYDGTALTSSDITWTGAWVQEEQATIEAVALGAQRLPNNGDGETPAQNTVVLLPAIPAGASEEVAAAYEAARDQLAYEAQEAAASHGGTGDASDANIAALLGTASSESDGSSDTVTAEQAQVDAVLADFAHLLSNYAITYTHGTLTVAHRTGSDRIALALVGATPAEALTYNGKTQQVTGYTANGFESITNDDGTQSAVFSLDVAGDAEKSREVVAREGDTGGDLDGDADGDASGDPSEEELVWTVEGVTASGSGKDVLTTAGATYPVTITQAESGLAVYDQFGNNVTSEFACTLENGSFEIAPIELTITAASVTRAYNTAELTAHTYTVEGGSFPRGEGLNDAKIVWSGAITRVGSVANVMDIEAAWLGNTARTNYQVTLVPGELTVTDSAPVSERLDASVTANSKQVEETGGLLTLDGFTSMDGSYATFVVETGTSVTTLYVEGLTAHGEGTAVGKHAVTVTGTAKIWDSKDANDRIDVTNCFNLTTYGGYLTIRKQGTNAVEFSNRAQLVGKTYNGEAIVPVAEGLKAGTQVFYTADKSVASAATGLAGATDELGNVLVEGTATAEAAVAAGWSATATGYTNAGEYTVYAMGLFDGKFTQVEEVTFTIAKRAVTLVSDTVEKPYDGLPLTATTTPKPATTSLGWVATDLAQLEITATGSQKTPGSSENKIVVAAAGTAAGAFESEQAAQEALDAVLKNYKLETQPGTLTVTSLEGDERIELTIVGATGVSLTYNGQEQEVTTFTVNGVASELDSENKQVATITAAASDTPAMQEDAGEAEDDATAGEDATTQPQAWHVSGVTASGKAKDVKVAEEADAQGEAASSWYAVTTTVQDGALLVTDEDGTNVTSQFRYTVADGSFEIAPRQVTVASKSTTKTYDLVTLSWPYYTVSGEGFVEGDGFDGSKIEWTGHRTSPGSSQNTFVIPQSAFNAGTKLSNYAITYSYGTLKINQISNADDKFQVTVKSKSDQQRMNEDESAIVIEGFENEIELNGKTYVPVTVSRSGFKATFYVTGLSASGQGSTRGTYENEISGSALVYDSMDLATRVSVTPSVAVTTQNGKLKLCGPKDDILVWTDENDVYEMGADGNLTVKTEGVDGQYYDATAKTPTIESKFYKDDVETPTTIYYTASSTLAEQAKTDLSEIKKLVDASQGGTSTAAEGDITTSWVTTAPSYTDANTSGYTFYAVGVRADEEALGGDEGEQAPQTRAATSDDEDSRLQDGKRYTEVAEFKLTILKRAVSLYSEGVEHMYDGTTVTAPTEVTTVTGGGFLEADAAKLTVSASGEGRLPGTYATTITVGLKPAEDGDGDENGAAGIATQAESDELTSILKNYQVVKYAGDIVISHRTGDDRYVITLSMPDLEYDYTGKAVPMGALYVTDPTTGEVKTLSVLSTKTDATITVDGHEFVLSGYSCLTSGNTNAQVIDWSNNSTVHTSVRNGGTIKQVVDGTTDTTDVKASFNVQLDLGTLTIKQGTGNELTSTQEWLTANAGSSTVASSVITAAQTAYTNLAAWSTWTYTGEPAAAIPAVTTAKATPTATYYALDATANAPEDATWYTASEIQALLVNAGTYNLSIKAETQNFEPCYGVNVVEVEILTRTVATAAGQSMAIYDPVTSIYGFTYDERGNLYDPSDTLVADSDGNPTAGAIEGLPAGPAAIYTQEVTYTGLKQELKPVLVDDQGRLLTEGVDYTITYSGDTVNVGSVVMHVASLPGGNYNLAFDLPYTIVASDNGALKAAEKYTYVYAGGTALAEPAIVANYGDSSVVYALAGATYESWDAVAGELANVGAYTVSVKTTGENYVASEGSVVIEVTPLDMSGATQVTVDSLDGLDSSDAEKDREVAAVYVAAGELTYTGEAQEPAVAIVDAYGNLLVEGRDYTTSVVAVAGRSRALAREVEAAVDAGSYALEVTYRGNYTGSSSVAFAIAKVAGNRVVSVDVSSVDGAVEGALGEPTVVAEQEGSTFFYSVDGGAFVAWAQAKQQLTAGDHTLVAMATHVNYVDAEGEPVAVSIASRPVEDAGSSNGSTGASGTGSAGSAESAGNGTASSSGGSGSAALGTGSGSGTGSSASSPSTSAASGTAQPTSTTSTAASTNAVASEAASSTAAPAEAVTVENAAPTSENAAESAGSHAAATGETAQVEHATYAYLTFTILAGILLTAAYSLTVIKQRSDEVRRLQPRAM